MKLGTSFTRKTAIRQDVSSGVRLYRRFCFICQDIQTTAHKFVYLYIKNIAKAIAEATNADVKEFYSCHNLTAEQFADGETYLSLMEKNVETLREVLN